jgi:hypothetical protein
MCEQNHRARAAPDRVAALFMSGFDYIFAAGDVEFVVGVAIGAGCVPTAKGATSAAFMASSTSSSKNALTGVPTSR